MIKHIWFSPKQDRIEIVDTYENPSTEKNTYVFIGSSICRKQRCSQNSSCVLDKKYISRILNSYKSSIKLCKIYKLLDTPEQ